MEELKKQVDAIYDIVSRLSDQLHNRSSNSDSRKGRP